MEALRLIIFKELKLKGGGESKSEPFVFFFFFTTEGNRISKFEDEENVSNGSWDMGKRVVKMSVFVGSF